MATLDGAAARRAGAASLPFSFAQIARWYDALNRLMSLGRDRHWRRLAAEAAGLPPGGRVLDVGVGTGRLARPLAERGVWVCGVDIAPRMLAKLMEQLDHRHVALDPVLADITQLPIAAGSFSASSKTALTRKWSRQSSRRFFGISRSSVGISSETTLCSM